MKVDEYEVLEELLYTKEHEWVKIVDNTYTVIGITDYAAKLLHDVVYVQLPSIGVELKQMDVLGSVESIKAVSDIYSPLSGKVIKVNEELSTRPELINQSPYGEGWMIELEPKDLDSESSTLMTAEGYSDYIKGQIEEKS